MKPPKLTKMELAALAVLIASLALMGLSMGRASKASARARAVEAALTALDKAAPEARALSARVRSTEARAGLVNVKDVTSAVEQVAQGLGLGANLKAQRGLVASGSEERVEAVFEGLTMNEAVNLLFALDTAPMPVMARKVTVKASFTRQGKLDVLVTAALLKSQ